MPTVVQTVSAGSQFDGTANKGLFDVTVDNATILCRIESVLFRTSASCTFTLKLQDPDTAANAPVLITGSGTDLYFTDLVLPKNSSGNNWAVLFTTSGMSANGYLTITYTVERRSTP
jgi:hypothetical protein